MKLKLFYSCRKSFPKTNQKLSGLAELIEISKEVYQKLAYRDTTEGILAVAKSKNLSLSELNLGNNPLVLIAESPEKPGNIGAMLRTADAAKLDAVIIANPKSDLYNPNIVRSSVGCLFTNQIATGTTEEIIAFLKKKTSVFIALPYKIQLATILRITLLQLHWL